MASQLIPKNLLWAVGVLQPVSAIEIFNYLCTLGSIREGSSSSSDIQSVLMAMRKKGLLVRVMRQPDLFSLSLAGTHALLPGQRKTRDRERIFLLRACQSGKILMSREDEALGSGGEAPPHKLRTRIEGSGASEFGPSDPRVRTRWPRHSKQLQSITGSSLTSRDTLLNLLSFGTESELNAARSGERGTSKFDFIGLGLMLGLTPQLLLQMYVKLGRHYRTFLIPKKDGTFRPIQSPKVYLKTVQRFINDYVIHALPVHENVHSFKIARSSVSNAAAHVNRKWVACIDIVDFFGSISIKFVENLLVCNGFDLKSSRIIAGFTTYLGKLPQGAPSSPLLSNAFLFKFDCAISEMANHSSITYTRYADDITISGSDRGDLEHLVRYMTDVLDREYGMKVNIEKTRIMSDHSRQSVTGAVVNQRAAPPRRLRRQIRAAAFNAKKAASISSEQHAKITGYISYLNSFPSLHGSAEIAILRSNLQLSNVICYTQKDH